MAEEKYRILVLDDQEDWLVTIKNILELKYALELTSNASQAIDLLKVNPYALVILDQRLPGTSGMEVLTRMRDIRPDLRAIMLTGFPDVGEAVDSMKLGALDYILKGTRKLPEELRTKVKEALEKTRVPSALSEQDLMALIAKGESAELEFKSSARWDVRGNKFNREMEKVIIKTVAAFLNSETGGTLLIGIDDGGAVIGIEPDYQTLGKKKDRDGYENFLTSILLDNCGRESSPLLRITFHKVNGKDVCQISVRPSPKPIFVQDDRDERFFIRAGNSTRLLSTREALEYCKMRWK